MFERIVVGVDGSPAAQRALAWAAVAARDLGAPLVVVHVADVSLIGPSARKEALADGHRLLADSVATAFELGVVEVSSALQTGDPAARLLEVAGDTGSIVVGTQRAGRIPRILLGSVAFRLAAQAPVPVVLVDAHDRLPDDEGATDVVVGEHDRTIDASAVGFATDLGARLGRAVVRAGRDDVLAAAASAAFVVVGVDRGDVHLLNPIDPIAHVVLESGRCAVVIVGSSDSGAAFEVTVAGDPAAAVEVTAS